MKRTAKLLYSICIMLCLALFCSASLFSSNNFKALAVEEVNKYDLIPAKYTALESWQSKYNIATNNLSNVVPFDIANKSFYDGSSFVFNKTENNQIDNQFVYVDGQTSFTSQTNLSLFVWIYFSDIYVHDLSITLKFNNDATCLWQLNAGGLTSLLQKTSVYVAELPYGWNKIELPFSACQKTGEIYNDLNQLNEISQMIINYKSNEIKDVSYSSLRFYNPYLSESINSSVVAVIKQNYYYSSFNFYDEETKSNLFVNDSITIKSLTDAVNYAVYGDLNLLSNANRWRVQIEDPDGNVNNYNFGYNQPIKLDKVGVYKIRYQYLKEGSSNEYLASGSDTIDIQKFRAIYFNKSSSKIEKDKNYVYYFNINNKLFVDGDVSVTCSSSNVKIEKNSENSVVISADKAGDYTVKIEVLGHRTFNMEPTTYSYEMSVKVYKNQDYTHTIIIILLCILGFIVVVSLYFIVKALIKTKHKSVR